MLRRRGVGLFVAATLVFGAPALVACDDEDERDAEQIIDDADKELDKLRDEADQEVDQLDKDGKDD